MKCFHLSLLFLLTLIHSFSATLKDSPVTLIPLTIFNESPKNWNEAINFCYDNFDVRLASSDYSLQNLRNIVDDNVEAEVWTGVFRRGTNDLKWWNQDGESVDLEELPFRDDGKKGGECLSWKKTPDAGEYFLPQDCGVRLEYACEVLKINFDSKMLKRYDKLFGGWKISTGVLALDSPLKFGPLVDHTLYEGKFKVEVGNEVNFTDEGEAGATSKYSDDFSAINTFFPSTTNSFWTAPTATFGDPPELYLNESIWFKFNTPLIVNKVTLQLREKNEKWNMEMKGNDFFYPSHPHDKVSFFGSDSEDCEDKRHILSIDVSLGNNSIDNRRKFLCYGIQAHLTSRKAKQVAIDYPLQYFEMNDCKQNCAGNFASIFEQNEEFKVAGNGNVHWKLYYHMRRNGPYDENQSNSISIGPNTYHVTENGWSLLEGNLKIEEYLNFMFISESIRIAIDDMIFSQDPINANCSSGKFGPTCERDCHCQEGVNCHLFSGFCYSGFCDDGFYGPDCQGEISCSPLRNSSHGSHNCTNSPYMFGTTCKLTCNAGYQLNVSEQIACNQTTKNKDEPYWENWPVDLPHDSDFCIDIDVCLPLTGNGNFSCDKTSNTFGAKCLMTCDGGYHLLRNVSEIIVCNQTNPNKGESHWEGWPQDLSLDSDFCIDIDECNKTACNQQKCTNLVGDYHCDCDLRYYGKDCENKIFCPLQNTISHGSITCNETATLKYSYGTTCQLTCKKGYQLLKNVSEIIVCNQTNRNQGESHWEGWPQDLSLDSDFCKDIDECNKTACNQHNCTNLVGDYHCDCDLGYYGKDCENKIFCPLQNTISHGSITCNETATHKYSYGTTCQLTCKKGYQLLKNVNASISCEQKKQNEGNSFWKGWPQNLTQESNFCVDINECMEEKCFNGRNCINTDGDYKCHCGLELVGKHCESNFPQNINKPNDSSVDCIHGDKCAIALPESMSTIVVFYVLKAILKKDKRRSDDTEEVIMFKDCEPRAGFIPLFFHETEKGELNYSTVTLQNGIVISGPCKDRELEVQQYQIVLSIETNVTNYIDRREFQWLDIEIDLPPISTLPPLPPPSPPWTVIGICIAVFIVLILAVVILTVWKKSKKPAQVRNVSSDYEYPSFGMIDRASLTASSATEHETITAHENQISIESENSPDSKNSKSPPVKARPSKENLETFFSPTSIPVHQIFQNVFKDKKSLDFYKEEFASLPKQKLFPYKIASSPENKEKNRFLDIPAYDHSRVKLYEKQANGVYANMGDEKVPANINEKSDYINANYMNGYKRERSFIACQGPKKQTLDDFWVMICKEKVDTIVMLTNLVEGGKKKCEKYWPNNINEPTDFGQISVTMLQEYSIADYTTRNLKVTMKDSKNKSRMIKLYHFTAWPDMGVPTSPMELTSFLHFIKNEHEAQPGKKSPIVVHCSAGVGRTGTFIALWNLLDEAKAVRRVDVLETVKQLRQCRYLMVQTAEQYHFIYENVAAASFPALEPIPLHSIVNICSTQLGKEYLTSLVSNLDVLCQHVQANGSVPQIANSGIVNPSVVMDSYFQKNSIRVTESPIKENVNEFAMSLLQLDIKTVIKLGQENEASTPELQSCKDFDMEVLEISDDDALCHVTKAHLKPKVNNNQQQPMPIHYYQLKTWPKSGTLPTKNDLYNFALQILKQQQTRGNPKMLVHHPKGCISYAIFVVLLHILERMDSEKLVHIPCAMMKAEQMSSNILNPDQLDLCFQIAKLHQETYDDYSNFQ